MKLPENYIFVSSFNTRLYKHRHNLFTKFIPTFYPKNPIKIYHENSFDLSNNNQSIDLNDFNSYKNIECIDLFEENLWLENFLKNSKFVDCHKSNNYYLKNSPFWFRKVVAISNAIDKFNEGDVMIWADVDSYIERELPLEFYEYFENKDWLVILRRKDWIESGFQFIKINERTKKFAKFYLNYYTSGDVFINEPEWADNWVLESCFKNYKDELHYSGLTPEFGCPININEYINHSKNPLKEVRDQFKI